MASTAVRGIAWMLLASLMYTVTGSIVRHLSTDYSVFQVAFFRSVVAVMILLPMASGFRFEGLRAGLKTSQINMHLVRSVLSYTGILCWFYSVARINLSDYYALQFLTPIFTLAGAALVLRERTGARSWIAIGVGFVGALVIIRPGFVEIGLGTMAALAAALLFASVNTAARVLSRTDSTTTIVVYGNLILIPLSLIPALFEWVTPTLVDLVWLCCVGVTGTIAQFSITRAVGIADARIIQPFDFMRLPFAAALGWVVFGELSDVWTWVGAVIIFVAGSYVLRMERR